jgi:hypothetical protein
LEKELAQAGLTLNEEEELQTLNSDIPLMEEDITNLRDDLAAADSNVTPATTTEQKERSKRGREYLGARNYIENQILA